MGQKEELDQLTNLIIGSAINVHQALGPGLLESAYTACLAYELIELGLKVEKEKPIPLIYKQVQLDCGYRLDLLIEDKIIIEIKAVESILPIHQAQVLSYLKLTDRKLGLILNFNVKLLRNGIQRIINGTIE